jgi:hypothetical protein
MTSLNPLLRAYGRFDVAQGRFTLYSQLGVKDDDINGYLKPMFSDLEVYDYQKDKNKGVMGQAKQTLIGTAAHSLKTARHTAGLRSRSTPLDQKRPLKETYRKLRDTERRSPITHDFRGGIGASAIPKGYPRSH